VSRTWREGGAASCKGERLRQVDVPFEEPAETGVVGEEVVGAWWDVRHGNRGRGVGAEGAGWGFRAGRGPGAAHSQLPSMSVT
jgi:hypothetical protein